MVEIVQDSGEKQENNESLLPEKQADPEPFTLPCQIGHSLRRHAIFDLGSSINKMNLLTFRRINRLEVRPTTIKIGLVNGKTIKPYGIVEDVPIKINNLSFTMDFFILEMQEHCFTTILLGRPFLATTRETIVIDEKELAIRSGKEYEILKFSKMS